MQMRGQQECSPTSSIPPVCVGPVGCGPKEALTTAGFDKEQGTPTQAGGFPGKEMPTNRNEMQSETRPPTAGLQVEPLESSSCLEA